MSQHRPIGPILLWGVYLALFYFLFLIVKPFIYPILWAIIFTIIFYPLHKKFQEWTNYRETISASLTMAIILFTVVLPGGAIVTIVVTEAIDFAQDMVSAKTMNLQEVVTNPYLNKVFDKIEQILGTQDTNLQEIVLGKIHLLGGVIRERSENILLEIPSAFADFFITLFTTFFLLRDGKDLANIVRNLLPITEAEVEYYFTNVKKVIFVTFTGVLLTALLQGIVAFVAFRIIGVKSSMLLGLLTTISSLVPVIGSALVWVPLSAYLLVTGSIAKGLLVLAVGALIISLIDNFLRPIFLHQYLSLHLLLTFFSLFGGIKAFGLIGIFLGPIIVSAFIGSCLFYRDFRAKFLKEQNSESP